MASPNDKIRDFESVQTRLARSQEDSGLARNYGGLRCLAQRHPTHSGIWCRLLEAARESDGSGARESDGSGARESDVV